MTQRTVEFHPLVARLVADFKPTTGRMALSKEQLAKWIATLEGAEAKQTIGTQLIALALRLRNSAAKEALAQVVLLAAIVLGGEAVRATLEADGFARGEIDRALTRGKAPASPQRGMSEPKASGATARKPRRPKRT